MAKKKTKESPSTVSFDFIKSNHFRVVSVDGVFGGLTPRGSIHMAAWSQRGALPDQVTHEFGPKGLGKEISRKGSSAFVREYEVGLVFDAGVAKAVIVWLEDKVRDLEAIEAAKKEGEENE